MATGYRQRYNFEYGTLGAALAPGDTTITFTAAPGFTTLGTDEYLAISLNNQEIVHLIAYTSGATTGTIERGQEGTAATSHDSGDVWVHGPTIRDITLNDILEPMKNLEVGATFDVLAGFANGGWNGENISSNVTNSNNVIEFKPIWLFEGQQVEALYLRIWTAGGVGSEFTMALYDNSPTTSRPENLIAETGAIDATTTGLKVNGFTPVTIEYTGWHWIGLKQNAVTTDIAYTRGSNGANAIFPSAGFSRNGNLTSNNSAGDPLSLSLNHTTGVAAWESPISTSSYTNRSVASVIFVGARVANP